MKLFTKNTNKKIKGLLIVSVLFISTTCFAYTWHGFGPDSVNANNVCFNICGHNIICASNGIYVNIGGSWNFYTHGGLPVWEAVQLDSANALLVMGNGTYSDGIYKFNFTTNQLTLVEYCVNPAFIKFNANNNLFYVGSNNMGTPLCYGLYSSTNGINWDSVPYFINKSATSIDFFNNHITVSPGNDYSSDNGITWNQTTSCLFYYIAFNTNGKLYGVFPGISNSSGLYSSADYGATWNYEQLSLSMNTVGFDVAGNVFVGWHNAIGTEEGVGVYNTLSHSFTFLNNGLPNKNINKFKINPLLSGIVIYCCTDSGVYHSNDYYTTVGIDDIISHSESSLSNYPNPFNSSTTIEYTIPENTNTPASLIVYDSKGTVVKELTNLARSKGRHSVAFNASSLNAGVYYYTLNTGNSSVFSKMIKYK